MNAALPEVGSEDSGLDIRKMLTNIFGETMPGNYTLQVERPSGVMSFLSYDLSDSLTLSDCGCEALSTGAAPSNRVLVIEYETKENFDLLVRLDQELLEKSRSSGKRRKVQQDEEDDDRELERVLALSAEEFHNGGRSLCAQAGGGGAGFGETIFSSGRASLSKVPGLSVAVEEDDMVDLIDD